MMWCVNAARTCGLLAILRPLRRQLFLLGQSPSGSYRPQILYDIFANADVPVVKVHGRIAVPWDEEELLAERRRVGSFDEAVLVRGLGELEHFLSPHRRHAGVDARSLQARVDDRGMGRRPAHHGGMPESTLEAFRPASTTAAWGEGRLITVASTKSAWSKRGSGAAHSLRA